MKLRRHAGVLIGTALLALSILLVVALDSIGWIDREWFENNVHVLQGVRVLILSAVLLFAITPVAGWLTRRFGGDFSWLSRHRRRLLFWYLAYEAVLFWGTL